MSIYTGNIYKIKNYDLKTFDEIWYIVRSLKNNYLANETYHVPQLSPSYNLFYKYLNWKKNNLWNQKIFQDKYVPQFLSEIKSSQESRQYLNALCNKGIDKSILLLCYCQEEFLCHRSIILGLIQGYYKENNIQTKCGNFDYTKYFNQYINKR
ncbi:MAG: hypothetical protein [Caudoviricetes sp.]|nr:MAG: hypothetical protein [Caudoviricetes sp.]